jgi:hypothetical protein
MSVGSGRNEVIEAILARASQLLDEETAALRSCKACDHSEFVARKNMLAFQLESLCRTREAGLLVDALTRERVEALRRSLQENQIALETHISVARDITRLIAEVVMESESDGTYTAEQARRGKKA